MHHSVIISDERLVHKLDTFGGSIDAPWGRMFAARPEISFSGGFSCVDLS
jgi:hypothetical protein